ncbi:hypothetical protein QAD02_021551 [Eretmocerus hayati]|uniref:Uncharacterized protein n=1 Tax=Eretmocerus hayati TaxID=131215 RepID=A0ACC2PRL5_9HYME|nr:hypothetical protein QAD02_021551 [Eretmocerus hayati]
MSDEVGWELKWSQEEDAEVHGPHTSEQMYKWSREGFFKKGAWVRKSGQDVVELWRSGATGGMALRGQWRSGATGGPGPPEAWRSEANGAPGPMALRVELWRSGATGGMALRGQWRSGATGGPGPPGVWRSEANGAPGPMALRGLMEAWRY